MSKFATIDGKELIRRIKCLLQTPSQDQMIENDDGTWDSLAHDFIFRSGNHNERVRELITDMPEEMRQELHAMRNGTEMTCFELAVDRDRTTLVEYVLSRLSNEECYDLLAAEQPGLGWTPLYRAVVRGNAGMVSILLSSINPTQRQQLMSTENGLLSMTRVLLFEPLDIVEAFFGQLEPNGRYNVLRSPLEGGQTLIHQLVMTGRHGVLQWILQNCAGRCLPLIQLKDSRGRNISHSALKIRDLKMMEIILSCLNQNDVNRVLLESDRRHMLAIHYAAESTSRQFSRKATRLVINSISPDLMPFMVTQKTLHDRTPFERAFEVGNIDAMQVIARALQRNPAIRLPAQGGAPRNILYDFYVPSPSGTATTTPQQHYPDTNIDGEDEDALSESPADQLMVNITDSLNRMGINTQSNQNGKNIPLSNNNYHLEVTCVPSGQSKLLNLNPNVLQRRKTLSSEVSSGPPEALTTHPIEMEKTSINQPIDQPASLKGKPGDLAEDETKMDRPPLLHPADASVSPPQHILDSLKETFV